MKIIITIIVGLLAFIVYSADLKTLSGKIYKDCEIEMDDFNKLHINYEGGATEISICDLPDNVLKTIKFPENFDINKETRQLDCLEWKVKKIEKKLKVLNIDKKQLEEDAAELIILKKAFNEQQKMIKIYNLIHKNLTGHNL